MKEKAPKFEVLSILDKRIRTSVQYWTKIVQNKHPSMLGKESDVIATLQDSDEVRISKSDPQVHLYYKEIHLRYVCVVVKHENGLGLLLQRT